MEKEQFAISQSKLEEARATANRDWLATTFARACQVIAAGGRVTITQELSGGSVELVAVIDNLEGLNHYVKKYSV